MSVHAEIFNNTHTNNSDSDKIRIFIRSPTISLADDFSILITPESTVLSLKQTIYERVPQKPSVSNQKLIYRGRLLNDSDRIIDLLGDGMASDQIFHLVVKPSAVNLKVSRATVSTGLYQEQSSTRRRCQQSDSTANGELAGSETSQPAADVSYEGMSLGAEVPIMQNPVLNFPDPTQLPFGQTFAAVSQDGVQQAVMNYPIQMPFAYPMHYVLINGLPYLVPVMYPYPVIQPQPVAAHAQPAIVQQPAEPMQEGHVRLQRRRHNFALIFKLGLFIYIFAHDASPERLILLHLLAFVIYLYQTGRLRIVRRRRVVVPNEAFPAAHPPQVPNIIPNDPAFYQAPFAQPNPNNFPTGSSDSQTHTGQPETSSSSSSVQARATTTTNADNSAVVPGASNTANASPAAINNRRFTMRDLEHAVYTFLTSLVPTAAPDPPQEEMGI
ncbi:9398_t:CDS:2 [Paraglomus occultum]|uniref:9398_t:CDS:1 n=1 Tax=Paraglomus occultum TaxID=144539 RepID=A0A9N8YWE4_9GLOM|nr:9398_t:CDS:2 [Paraglomus occultum]